MLNAKYRFTTDISNGTKSISVFLQVLSIGVEASFELLPPSMKGIDDHCYLKRPTCPHNSHL